MFYLNGKKIIPTNIYEYLKDPITLTVWFMDDGNIKGISYNLNTQSYSQKENILLANCMTSIYGLEVRLERNHKKYFRLYIPGTSARILADIIKPYIIPSMQYKLG